MSENILDIYDSEVQKLLDVQAEIEERIKAKQHNYNDLEREIKERFAAIGFRVVVNWWTYEIDGVPQEGAMPEVKVVGRTDTAFRFDPDRQVHETVHNVLELPGEEGWISTDKETVRRFLDGNGGHHHH